MVLTIGWNEEESRNIKNTPAVTNVDECTNAEIGVGAAIAIGSQAEKGNWALFEQPAIDNISNAKIEYSMLRFKFQLDDNIIIAIDMRIRISPIRFLRRVMVPEAADEKFW